MIFTIYGRAMNVLAKKPFVLWGISLLCGFLTAVSYILFGIIPGVAMAITWLLETSMTMIYLYGFRGEEVKCSHLFNCFKDAKTIKRVLGGMGWMYLWIFLWALIPFVGWIFALIRCYRYCFTPYILMTEPDVPITEAIKVSSERTMGWKGKMFGADILVFVLIFVGFLILGLLCLIPFIGVLFKIIYFIAILAVVAFTPLFLGLVNAAFFEEASNPGQYDLTHGKKALFCGNCGCEVAEDAAFCPSCGKSLH